jgi:biotin carboxyl carrier protein
MIVSGRQAHVEYFKWAVWILLTALLALAIVFLVSSKPAAQEPAKTTALIVSPAQGMFQAGGSPGSEPFVRVGSEVEPGTLVGTVDSMIMQPPGRSVAVTAGVRGTITRVLVVDGQMVDIGQPLFEVLAGR